MATTSKRRKNPPHAGGRPPLPEGTARDVTFRARLTPAQRDRLEELAASWGGTPSALVRAWIAEAHMPRLEAAPVA